jgi:hypothetical protein
MKNKKYSYALVVSLSNLLLACAIILSGCAKQQQYEAVEQILVPACSELAEPNMDKAKAMQIAEDVLVKMHFTIEKADPNAGFMRTNPLPGAQFFEFWRKDNVGSENAALANLHTIRRIVELNISQAEEKLCIGCDVQVYRLSMAQDQSTSRALAPGMFTESSDSTQNLRLRSGGEVDVAWVNLGQDKQLATDILKRIEKRLASQTGHEQVATGSEK